MGIDIRIPIGGMFSILGLMMLVYGLVTSGDAMYARSLDINVNLYWGAVMCIFGGLMLGFGLRSKAVPKPAAQDGARPAGH